MRSTPSDGSPVRTRRAWEAPVVTELPIGTQTRSAAAEALRVRAEPPTPPAEPSSKLGFSFEMSFPLSVRTE